MSPPPGAAVPPIYLDYNATTPVSPEALELMTAASRDLWHNPSSATEPGRRAKAAINAARRKVSETVGGSRPEDEVTFTSGGTEVSVD